MKKIIIAIDGYSACGKSTLAKQLAEKLNYIFLDTGAMYRAVTLYLLRNHIDWNNSDALHASLKNIEITFRKQDGNTFTYLNGENVEDEIRNTAVADKVSEVAAVSAVRKFLVKQQQEIGKQKGIVLDGRDIGTVVFPEAELKLFITASLPERVQRRYLELKNKGINITPEQVQQNLEKRDLEETTRTDSPLMKPSDAVVIDNTDLTPEEQFLHTYQLVMNVLKEV